MITPDNRKKLLPVLLLVLLAAVVFDTYYQPEEDNSAPPLIPARAYQLVANEANIQRDYGLLAPLYAEVSSEFLFFTLDITEFDSGLRVFINQALTCSGNQDPEIRFESQVEKADGVYQQEGTIKFTARQQSCILQLIEAIGQPRAGIDWKNFTVRGDEADQQIEFSGKFTALAIEARE